MTVTIPLDEPASREAVVSQPVKEFAQAYILSLNVNAYTASGNDYITIDYCPFDKSSGERLLNDKRTLTVPFWQVVESVPEAAEAFTAVGNALPVLIAYKKQVEADIIAQEAEAQEAQEALEAQAAEAQEALTAQEALSAQEAEAPAEETPEP
jgi:hypothetical protein